jgi:hypothetical protein
MNSFNNEINRILSVKMLDRIYEIEKTTRNIFYWFLDRKIEKEDVIDLIVNNFLNEEIINFPSKNYDEKIQILENKYKIQKKKEKKNKKKINEKIYLIERLKEQIKILDKRLFEVLNEKEEIKIRSLQEGYNRVNGYFIDNTQEELDKKADEIHSHSKFLLEELERLEKVDV